MRRPERIRLWWLAPIALGAALVGFVVLRGSGVDRGAYVKQNVAVIESLPVVPGASEKETISAAIRGGETVNTDVIGYGTTRVYKLSATTRPVDVIRFFDSRMKRAGWQPWHQASGLALTQRKGDAYAVIYGAVRGEYRVQVDHDCFEGGDAPRCFGP